MLKAKNNNVNKLTELYKNNGLYNNIFGNKQAT